MNELDAIAPAFRRARDHWPHAANLVAHYNDLATTYAGNQHSLIELIKSFIETVCVTVLMDYGQEIPSKAKTTGLLTRALEQLGLKNTRGASRFDKVLAAHNQLVDALTHMRNQEGPVAHGKDGYLDALSENHVRVYLLSADAILSLLLGALDGVEPNLQHTREPYERFEHLHARIDASVRCDAEWEDDADLLVLRFTTEALEDVRFRPSEILFHLDRPAYVAVLDSLVMGEPVGEAAALRITLPSLDPWRKPESVGRITSAEAYDGRLSVLSGPLLSFLPDLFPRPLPLSGEALSALSTALLAELDALAVVDWLDRESVKSRIRVAFKRRLRATGLQGADSAAKRLLQWFEHQDEVDWS